MNGLLTYSGILGALIFSIAGELLTKDESNQVATIVLTLVSLGVAAYGRYRIKKATY